ncbi:MAG TPA: hypothetical protein VH815_14590 [Acidobacteriota bacterium]|jgi:hypothetical protein
MITIFAIPKAFQGHIEIIQRNAIQSWTLLRPRPRLILFGNDEGTKGVAEEFNIEHVPSVACSEYGTPIIQDVFKQARQLSNTPLLCYINSDIILMSDFLDSIKVASESMKQFLLCGRRWNLDIVRPLDFSEGWEDHLKQQIKLSGTLEEAWAIDYFVYSSQVGNDMPPFIIGRAGWDNWFLYSVRAKGIPLIDATTSIQVVHQNHDYRHVPAGSGKSYAGPETDINLRLSGNLASEFSIKDATHELYSGKLKRTLNKDALVRHLDMMPKLKPWTAPIVSTLRFLLRITKPIRSNVAAGRNKS